MTAFSDLCDLMLQAEHFNPTRQTAIQKELGDDGRILFKSVTNISPFLEKPTILENNRDTKEESGFAMFKVACENFVRAMSCKDHPVIIFLDDVQWADKGSQDLMRWFLKSTKIESAMLILSFRDKEVDKIKDSLLAVAKDRLLDIEVHNLDPEEVYQFLRVKLQLSKEDNNTELHHLSTLIFRKTDGNPFLVLQFIDSLRENKLIVKRQGKCKFNLDHIKQSTMVSDALANNLVSQKLKQCDAKLIQLLQVASLFGYRFSASIIADATIEFMKQSVGRSTEPLPEKPTVNALLENAVNENILESLSSCDMYQFSHDKIQAAFLGLIEESTKWKMHLVIGQRLLNETNEAAGYHAALHLNASRKYDTNQTVDCIELSKLNLQAAKYCESRSDFSKSASFLRQGLSLLDGNEKWTKNYDLAIEMTRLLATMEFIVGNIQASMYANQQVLFRAKSSLLRYPTIFLEAELALATGQPVLVPRFRKILAKNLEIRIPRYITPLNVFLKLERVRKYFRKYTDNYILSLPRITDNKIFTTVRVLVTVASDCLIRDNEIAGAYIVLLNVILSFSYGLCEYTSAAIVYYGILESMIGNKATAYRLGELSLKMNSAYPAKDVGGGVSAFASLYILYREHYLKHLLTLCSSKLADALAIGDHLCIVSCLFFQFNAQLWTGENLKSLEASMLHVYARAKDLCSDQLHQFSSYVFILPTMQLVINLQKRDEDWKDLTVLSGAIMDEGEGLKKNGQALWIINFCKMYIQHLFEFYEEAYGISRGLCDDSLATESYFALPFHFLRGITAYRLYHSTCKPKYIRTARKCIKSLKKHHSACPNATPYLRLLEIEELSMSRCDADTLEVACTEIIDILAEEGLSNLEGFANEQAYKILKRHGRFDSNKYLKQAAHAYGNKWGALAKYEWMRYIHQPIL
eukprot:CAMPEP_0178935910 /NCGR_PEP_ID=MMETSP0786-20121207/24832_1 /TAXON_ID=186022 /ORGANISM="Thalassionema frauenfeldii, Strain CCMP 1798" /LENGTH=920 /DNA_ID=CAMNT_0020614159 /DNA_START=302 /DNA_END=3064 /DNA_ORIENTATION=-